MHWVMWPGSNTNLLLSFLMVQGDLDELISHENEVIVEHLKLISSAVAGKDGQELSECVVLLSKDLLTSTRRIRDE